MAAVAPAFRGPGPWTVESDKPSPHTTPLARFRDGIQYPVWSSHPLAATVFHARCEIRDHETGNPRTMALASDGSCIALASATGYKERDPFLQCLVLGETGEEELLEIELPLADLVSDIALGVDRHLVFAGDGDRIKSYAWIEELEPVHTLNSWCYHPVYWAWAVCKSGAVISTPVLTPSLPLPSFLGNRVICGIWTGGKHTDDAAVPLSIS